jgi:catechol 2,3-dioxygenase-like lactoylglutathione lyase family enzyme
MVDAESRTRQLVDGIFHPVLVVSTMDEALRFFVSVLGMRVTFDAPHDPTSLSRLLQISPAPNVRAVIVECPDGTELEIVEYLDEVSRRTSVFHDPRDPGVRQLSMRVHDLDLVVEAVENAGYTFTSPIVEQPLPDGHIVRLAVCIGPSDVYIALVDLRDRPGLAALDEGS